VQEIVKRAENLTDYQLHSALSEVFISLRDLHTVYKMPGPHACYQAVQALSFNVVQDEKWSFYNRKLVVSGFNKNQPVLDLSKPALDAVSIGDEVIMVDWMTFSTYVSVNKFRTDGSNSDGAMRAALLNLSVRNGVTRMMPKQNSVQYVMRSIKNGTIYFLELPWVASRSDACHVAWTSPSIRSRSLVAKSNKKFSYKDLLISSYQTEYAGNFATVAETVNFNLKDTTDPILKYGIWKPESANMGVIVLKSFSPGGMNALRMTELIRQLLVKIF
jgi:hypothetical protein